MPPTSYRSQRKAQRTLLSACGCSDPSLKLGKLIHAVSDGNSSHVRRCKIQDGRRLRRYKKRWNVEWLFVWLHWSRHLVVHYEYHIEKFLGMVHLGCTKMLLKYL